MIEKILLDYLQNALDVPVYMEIPSPMPANSFIVLEKTGSGAENHIFSATMAIQSYAASLYAAATLNEEVKGAMLYGITPPEICAVRLNSDYNYTDPDLKKYRYQAVFDLTHYYGGNN